MFVKAHLRFKRKLPETYALDNLRYVLKPLPIIHYPTAFTV